MEVIIDESLTFDSATSNTQDAVLANDIRSNASMHPYDAPLKLDRLHSNLLRLPWMACLLQNSDCYTTSC